MPTDLEHRHLPHHAADGAARRAGTRRLLGARLPPGARLRVLAAGDRPILDVQLQIGDATTAIEVTADAPIIVSENASVGQTITTMRPATTGTGTFRNA